MKRIAAIAVLLAAVLTSSAFAQCVMCFRTAAAQGAARASVLNMGIIIMLIPPVVILAGFMVLAYHRSRTYAISESTAGEPTEQELAEMVSADRP